MIKTKFSYTVLSHSQKNIKMLSDIVLKQFTFYKPIITLHHHH